MMKKIIMLWVVMSFSVVAFSATACPKGEHPYGGVGSHHRGGYCA
ncbi:hypothetical protein [Photobacterium damselae]|nr:hypothetical protein [Photobacterium damselae]